MLQSIYTHAGCDEIGHPVWTLFDVSIHTPTQGVTLWLVIFWLIWSFNPHTHAGCDSDLLTPANITFVSIHTPTQGVTQDMSLPLLLPMFQSTHPRRVWLYLAGEIPDEVSFNPHTHAGCDCYEDPNQRCGRVSIHTPTQGVTEYLRHLETINEFQSTHPRRVWRLAARYFRRPSLFQSTHPRRVWPYLAYSSHTFSSFNPHTHAGCDKDTSCYIYMPHGFQSTHPRRVWQICNCNL